MPGGRPKGSPNKNKQALLNLLQSQYPDYHPVLEMAKIAHDENANLALRASMHKEIAQYVTPKLKAVDINLEADARPSYYIVGPPMANNAHEWSRLYKPSDA
jgi:hypothetical protein